LISTSRPILVTGSAGFIGYHLSKKLLDEGFDVVGIDVLNDYYDVNLKLARNSILKKYSNYHFENYDLQDVGLLKQTFEKYRFEYVVHLAAQAGVRYSLINPFAYTESNITAFVNILERCRDLSVKHLLFASSSSVYGANTKMPFSTHDNVDHPISLYGATKKANELIAHSYASNFQLPVTGLRFFTVYGPWGRPDMALFIFVKSILEGRSIDVFNHGQMKRDFTYVTDIVEGIFRLLEHAPIPNPEWYEQPKTPSSFSPYRIFNIGNNQPVELMEFIEAIERSIGKKAQINYKPIQKGDVPATFADVSDLESIVGYKPNTGVEAGIEAFVKWYKDFYQ
jgi:UDP-glucuronate 4-epimerase